MYIYSLILKYRKMLQTISIVYISYKPISLASRLPRQQIIPSELLYLTSYKMFDLVSIHALLVIGLIVLCKPCSAQGPLVTLPHGGQLRGISTTSQQTQIDIFLGKFETVGGLPWIFDFALVTLKVANFELKSHFCPLFTTLSLHSSHLRAVFPLFHFFIFKNGLLSLFILVTLNMVSPPYSVPMLLILRFIVYFMLIMPFFVWVELESHN